MIASITSSGKSDPFSVSRRGVERGVRELGEAAQKIAEGDISPENAVQMIQAEVLVKANVAAMRTADEILGSLIDTLA